MDENRLLDAIAQLIEQSEERTAERIKQLEVTIENDVTKKVETLFDGYKLTHEKQWELERKTQALETQLEEIKIRLYALEHTTA